MPVFNLMRYTKIMKLLNILGLTIVFAGFLALAGYGFYKFFEDSTIPIVVRWGIIAVILGVIILLGSLIRERLKEKNL